MHKNSHKLLGVALFLFAGNLLSYALHIAGVGQPFNVLTLCSFAIVFTVGGFVAFAYGKPDNKPLAKDETILTFAIPKSGTNRLSMISKAIGARDYTEVIREALRVFDALVMSKVENGAQVFVEYSDGTREELVSPFRKIEKPADEKTHAVGILDEMAKSDFGVTEDKAREVISNASISMENGELIATSADGSKTQISNGSDSRAHLISARRLARERSGAPDHVMGRKPNHVEQWVCIFRENARITAKVLEDVARNFTGPVALQIEPGVLPCGMIKRVEVRRDEQGAYLCALVRTLNISGQIFAGDFLQAAYLYGATFVPEPAVPATKSVNTDGAPITQIR